MSCSPRDISAVDVAEVALRNPKVDLDRVREVREIIRTLCKLGVRERGYTLAPLFRRTMHPVSPYRVMDEEADPAHPWRCPQ